jgi:uncharacterized SAM-binding protein YcdF (DUF218 family)
VGITTKESFLMARFDIERAGLMKKTGVIGIFLVFMVAYLVVAVFEKPLLISVARTLVYEDPLEKAEAIVVLSGSSTGNRIEAATRLYHAGFGERLIFSGFEVYPGVSTSILMKNYALELGIPETSILTENAENEVSTRGESRANLELLKKHNISKFILLTSAYHTGRSQRIYKKKIVGLGFENMEFIVYPAFDPEVPISRWWKLRTGQKGILIEYLKSVAYYFNL